MRGVIDEQQLETEYELVRTTLTESGEAHLLEFRDAWAQAADGTA